MSFSNPSAAGGGGPGAARERNFIDEALGGMWMKWMCPMQMTAMTPFLGKWERESDDADG